VTQGERQKITAQGADLARCNKPVPARFAPAGYIQAPDTAVPMMARTGWTRLAGAGGDAQQRGKAGGPFTKTFLYGSYDGKLAFYEPMITQEWLATKPQHTEEIKLPAAYEKSGYYPTRYSVRHDAALREYTIALEGCLARGGRCQSRLRHQREAAAAKAPVGGEGWQEGDVGVLALTPPRASLGEGWVRVYTGRVATPGCDEHSAIVNLPGEAGRVNRSGVQHAQEREPAGIVIVGRRG
jgi:hypothetical protein